MELAQVIDHTVLKPDCTKKEIEKVCAEAVSHHFKAVCVPPYYVKEAAEYLKDSDVKIATVIGFPMGYSATPSKVEEIKRALNDGVDELDVVINISAVKNGDWSYVRNDIDSSTRAVHLKGKMVKIILETALITDEELEKLCKICTEIGVDYIKTSTGFNGDGASVEVVSRLRSLLPKNIKIKASGGIRTKEQVLQFLECGADRIGSSRGIDIIKA